MRKSILQLLLLVIVITGATSCGSYVPVAAGDNFAYLYGKGAAAIRLQARLYRSDADHSVIYFKLRTTDLLYKGTGGGGPYHARVVMSYEAYPAPGSRSLLDSASTFVKDQSMVPNEDKELIGNMQLKNVGDAPFVLRITARDLNRDAESTVMLRVDRGIPGSGQEFLPLGENGLPLFDDHVRPGTSLKMESDSHAGALLHVDHYPPVTKLPAPVFAEAAPPALDVPSDSSFTIRVQPDGRFSFTVGKNGFYHFRADTASMNGYTVFVPTETYPTVTTALDMVAPLRYITSSKEWDALATSRDPRKEVERFWTDAAGSRDRAREAIAGYYGRVESANRHFTSYTEGWKTDRGLVHIIFGTPTTIRKNANSETWVYGDETNLMSLVFNFERRNEPFSDNDLVLQRDPRLKSAWYRNVESWRNGRILQN
ncbi:MAG: GWxTD domain-containing protein [Flavobacteriales bacterium]